MVNKSEIKISPETKSKKTKDMVKEVEDLNKAFGSGFSIDGAKNVEEGITLRYPSGIEELDKALGGDDENGYGFPAGRVVEIAGAESCGKTWLLSKTYQNLLNKGYRCLHVDIEQTYDLAWARLNGVDTKKLARYVPPMTPKVEYAEQTFEKIIKVIALRKFDFVGVDSIANLIPESIGLSVLGSQQPGRLANFMTSLMAKIVPVCAATGTTIVFVNQLRDKMGMGGFGYGPATDTPGGRSFKHNCSVRINVRKKTFTKTDEPSFYEGDTMIAHRIFGTTIKNKTAPPNRQFSADLYYKPKRMAIQFIADAIEELIIEKNKSNHKKFEYNGEKFEITERGNNEQVFDIVREKGWLMDIVTQMGANNDNIQMMIEDGDLTPEEVNSFYDESDKKASKEDLSEEELEGFENV